MSSPQKIVTEKATFTDWRDGSLYEDREEWSNRRWAWEFLRRNKKYQEVCKGIKGPSQAVRAKAAAEFGRCNLKMPYNSYNEREDNEKLWLSETVLRMKAYDKHDTEEQVATFPLQPGEVCMVFNLKHAENGGPAAVVTQIEYAKRFLLEEVKDAKYSSIGIKPTITKKPQRELWPKLLRLYDAKVHDNASVDEIIDILYLSKADKGKRLSPQEKIPFRKTISEHLKKAKDMVEFRYLSLIPLDYNKDSASNNKNST